MRSVTWTGKLISSVVLALFILTWSAEMPVYGLPITTVYIRRPDTRYHRRNCIAVRQQKTAISLAKAQSLGFAPCPRCKPATW